MQNRQLVVKTKALEWASPKDNFKTFELEILRKCFLEVLRINPPSLRRIKILTLHQLHIFHLIERHSCSLLFSKGNQYQNAWQFAHCEHGKLEFQVSNSGVDVFASFCSIELFLLPTKSSNHQLTDHYALPREFFPSHWVKPGSPKSVDLPRKIKWSIENKLRMQLKTGDRKIWWCSNVNLRTWTRQILDPLRRFCWSYFRMDFFDSLKKMLPRPVGQWRVTTWSIIARGSAPNHTQRHWSLAWR